MKIKVKTTNSISDDVGIGATHTIHECFDLNSKCTYTCYRERIEMSHSLLDFTIRLNSPTLLGVDKNKNHFFIFNFLWK